ncbi:hypothetical protein PtA15_7A700 [Puccinia triticina]|uniref:Arf-GAP domain-containing protein n=1 Tax=Puccinia triticina TaxID=208348 RepID=A0ABY7CNZ5_9BASI|nr:uncharacterized protein PtA15_7A700 [Puccinia triticina]WAQ86971.1 hypothetical protein PtA15_7A700 [Puccinia triticina]
MSTTTPATMSPSRATAEHCLARNPRWAAWNLGIFICLRCAAIHRNLGTHISKVKSVSLDSWTKEQLQPMKQLGNLRANQIYNPHGPRNPPPTDLEQLEKYIRAKYQAKRFMAPQPTTTSRTDSPLSRPSPSAVPASPAQSAPRPPPAANAPQPPPLRPSTAPIPSIGPPHPIQPAPALPAHPAGRIQNSTAPHRTDGVWADLLLLAQPHHAPPLRPACTAPTPPARPQHAASLQAIHGAQAAIATHNPFATHPAPRPAQLIHAGLPPSNPFFTAHQQPFTEQPFTAYQQPFTAHQQYSHPGAPAPNRNPFLRADVQTLGPDGRPAGYTPASHPPHPALTQHAPFSS